MFKKPHLIALTVIVLILAAFVFIFTGPPRFNPNQKWGANFNSTQAEYLGLDWRETYAAILDDLNVKYLRLSVFWNQVEQEPGQFDFSIINYQLQEAQKRGAKVILAVGRKAPRWPECHIPSWAEGLAEEEAQRRVLILINKTINELNHYDNIIAWQIENEPLLKVFTPCGAYSRNFLIKEIEVARAIDSARPILLSESGELSTWLRSAGPADIIGISIYRNVYNQYLGYLKYPFNQFFYIRRAQLIKPWVEDVIITELQAEPWFSKDVHETSLEEQKELFNSKKFADAIQTARLTGFSQVYLWGVEYFYYLKKRGDDSLWNQARPLFVQP